MGVRSTAREWGAPAPGRRARALRAAPTVLDEQAFADRAAAAFAQDEVQAEVGTRIADRAIEAEPALAPLRPTLEAAVSDAVRGWALPRAFHDGVACDASLAVQRAGRSSSPLPGAAADMRAASSRSRALYAAPARRSQALPPRRRGAGDRGSSRSAPTAQRAAPSPRSRWSAGLLALILAAFRAPTLRRGARRAALGFALPAGVLVAMTTSAARVVLSTFDTSHGDAVVGTIWDSFLGDLRFWGLVVGAGASSPRRCSSRARAAPGGKCAAVLTPCGRRARLARAAALLVLAVLLAVDAGGPARSRGHHARRRALFSRRRRGRAVSSAR